MILALDVGSRTLFGGLLDQGKVLATFQKGTGLSISSDELGLFLLNWLQVQEFEEAAIEGLIYCSVVPEFNEVIQHCSKDYFHCEAMTLKAGVKSGVKVKYSNHNDLGGDLLSNAVAALHLYPGKNLIIVDFGTATTLCGVSAEAEYLGGTLVPGLDISMEALAARTARLPAVEIQAVPKVCGRDMVSGIQGGIYWGTLGMLKELIYRMKKECFNEDEVTIIATGKYGSLYNSFGIFHHLEPNLVLLGLERIRQINI